jgi:hypothetical protein
MGGKRNEFAALQAVEPFVSNPILLYYAVPRYLVGWRFAKKDGGAKLADDLAFNADVEQLFGWLEFLI